MTIDCEKEHQETKAFHKSTKKLCVYDNRVT